MFVDKEGKKVSGSIRTDRGHEPSEYGLDGADAEAPSRSDRATQKGIMDIGQRPFLPNEPIFGFVQNECKRLIDKYLQD
jgi:hypothetical protein